MCNNQPFVNSHVLFWTKVRVVQIPRLFDRVYRIALKVRRILIANLISEEVGGWFRYPKHHAIVCVR